MNWVLVSLFPEFYPPNVSIVTVRYKPLTRKTDAWRTLVSNDPEYRNK